MAEDLEQSLRNLPRIGTLVKDRGHRQIWRFVHGATAYYLKFYPRSPRLFARLLRAIRGSAAVREFRNLQALQRAAISAPRAIAVLMGFRINAVVGDAVILQAIEPSVPLDAYLNGLELAAEPVPDRWALARQMIELVHKLGLAKLGHRDLNLGNFLLKEGKLYLIDAYAIRHGGLRRADAMQLGHSVARYATRGDLLRGWRTLSGSSQMPPRNSASARIWRNFMRRVVRENKYFGRIAIDVPATSGQTQTWTGVYFKHYKYPYRWAPASALTIGAEDWRRQWPALLAALNADTFPYMKRSPGSEVVSATITLGGRTLEVVMKRPWRRQWYRYINDIWRGTRARRAWDRAWTLLIRNIPTAWPLLLMERRRFGYVLETVLICERVPGDVLANVNLDAMPPSEREMLFRRTGKLLRKLERLGFSHYDAKASNWVVRDDDGRGPSPVLIDVDGIRPRNDVALGISRLLRSLREHKQYTVPDSLALCRGYAPYAYLQQEEEGEKDEG